MTGDELVSSSNLKHGRNLASSLRLSKRVIRTAGERVTGRAAINKKKIAEGVQEERKNGRVYNDAQPDHGASEEQATSRTDGVSKRGERKHQGELGRKRHV